MSLDHRALRELLSFRPEAPADHEAVDLLTDLAFGATGQESVERRLLRQLRADGDIVDELTLVAEVDGEVIGQVACSRATLAGAPSVGLGPISVRPDLQRKGIGAGLMSAVIATAERRGDPVIVLLGDPEYYGFFGFLPASSLGIGSPGPWGDACFQALPLRSWRPEMAGPFEYARAFSDLEG